MSLMVEAKSLSKVFTDQGSGNQTVVFTDFNFEVERETTVALVGPSGSGKSTLLNLISGLDNPSDGSIVVDGKDIHAMSPDQSACFRNQTIGFVFQSHHLMPALSAHENVMLPALAGHGLLEGKELRIEQASFLMRSVCCLETFGNQLSGGEKQKLRLPVLLSISKLLLADEPTGEDQKNAKIYSTYC